MKREVVQQALAILGPLEDDPQGQRLSRAGAEATLQAIVLEYESFTEKLDRAPRPGKIRQELNKIAKRAAALRQVLADSSDIARLAVWATCGVTEKPSDPRMHEVYLSADGAQLPYPGMPDIDQNMSSLWLKRLEALEHIHKIAAQDHRLDDSGGSNLRAHSRWFDTPNHWLVRQCRALLGACGRPCGGTREGPLVLLLSAVREMAVGDGTRTTFTNDIREVLKAPQARLDHNIEVARFVLYDLHRRQRPKKHPDVLEAMRQLNLASKERQKLLDKTSTTPEK